MKHSGFKDRVLAGYGRITQIELSRRLNIPRATLNGYLNQTSDLPTNVLTRFAEDTGLSVDYLLTGKDTFTGFKAEIITLLDGTDAEENEQTRAVIRSVLAALPKKQSE